MEKSKYNTEEQLWLNLATTGNYKLLELCHRAEIGKIKEIHLKAETRLCKNIIINNTIIKFLEKKGVKVLYDRKN